MFSIRMGVPEMEEFWSSLCSSVKNGTATKTDVELHAKTGKTLALLSSNPKHPGLHSHEIKALTRRYGVKVWESYLENKNSKAWRLFWGYGPDKSDITIIGMEPHPNDKKDSYKKITLSDM